MGGCTYENWTLLEVRDALQNAHKDNKHIVVPMFQRGLRWDNKRKKTFIDSMQNGFPVGTMLFYETIAGDNRNYILVDGLQRSNCIREFINNPTKFIEPTAISDEFCQSVAHLLGLASDAKFDDIRRILVDFVKKSDTLKNLQYYYPAKSLIDFYNVSDEKIGDLITVLQHLFADFQDTYDKIALSVIPVIIYTGQLENLPIIFDRINSKGVPLNQYEVYAASWPIDNKFKVDNVSVIQHVIDKYENYQQDGYVIHDYSREGILTSKKLNAFEYLFGLSKYLTTKYQALSFDINKKVDEVNPFAFELVNACLNDSDKIKKLYININQLDVNAFEVALVKSIEFVISCITPILYFKGNRQSSTSRKFHSKFQIMSMISTTFKEMYEPGHYNSFKESWENRSDRLRKNLLEYYIYDILTDYWSEGGTGKIHTTAKSNRYLIDIDAQSWNVALNNFFEKSMRRCEKSNIALPKAEEYVILNCIYKNRFTAHDQLSEDKFDIEHIAPKKQLLDFIKNTNSEGLPISCVANLCYLPLRVNRVKHDRNFYQDTNYLAHINLEEVEMKYSLTTADDLEWMDMYFGNGDSQMLRASYIEFLRERFEKLKTAFFESLNIDTSEITENTNGNESKVSVIQNVSNINNQDSNSAEISGRKLTVECIKKYQILTNTSLFKIKGNTYASQDGSKEFFFSSSKDFHQGSREKYWFAYRKNQPWSDNADKYYVLGCRKGHIIFKFPISFFEDKLNRLNKSYGDNGEISHWHIVIFIHSDNYATLLLSHPDLQEIDITEYILNEGNCNT